MEIWELKLFVGAGQLHQQIYMRIVPNNAACGSICLNRQRHDMYNTPVLRWGVQLNEIKLLYLFHKDKWKTWCL